MSPAESKDSSFVVGTISPCALSSLSVGTASGWRSASGHQGTLWRSLLIPSSRVLLDRRLDWRGQKHAIRTTARYRKYKRTSGLESKMSLTPRPSCASHRRNWNGPEGQCCPG